MSAFVFGHIENQELLNKNLPVASLFVGPDSVGKHTLAYELAKSNGVHRADYLDTSLTMPNALSLQAFSSRTPVGRFKLAIVTIKPNEGSNAAQNAVLKLVEEASQAMKFIFVAERTTPINPALSSRLQQFHFGYLPEDTMIELLKDRGMQQTDAEKAAKLAHGQVWAALNSRKLNEEKRPTVQVLRAFRENSVDILEKVALVWTDRDSELLGVWAREALTGQWRVFSQEESEIQGTKLPLRVLMELRLETRPRLFVRSALISILQGD